LPKLKALICLCMTVALGGACAGLQGPRTPAVTQPASQEPVTSADGCSGIGPAPSSPVVTFLSGSLVFQMQPDGSSQRCLVRAKRPLTLAWSAGGDRVLLGGLQTFLPSGERPIVEEQVRSPRWSRPSGKATIHISIDSKRLLKVPAEGGTATDISFLTRHDEVVYHPAGTHIAVAGLAKDGSYGIFLATNTGKDPQPLANAETAKSISALVFDEQGESLYFAADHGEHHHLHRLHIGEGRLETYAETREPISRIFVSQDGKLAYREGSCTKGTETMVRQAEGEIHAAAAVAPFVEPAGWLPDGGLLLIARQSSCDEAGDLRLWAGGSSTKLLAEKVDRAAIRAAAQSPPPPPPIPGAGVA
jgi:hypothetical protein